jgi:pre-mRNA-splicing factor 38A
MSFQEPIIPRANNRTAHGKNPELLIEKILRMKIYDNCKCQLIEPTPSSFCQLTTTTIHHIAVAYWKEHCFALTATTLLDKATRLSEIGGTFGGGRRPTTFVCLALKMLQITPEQEIAIAYVQQDEFKYVRALGAFYLRLTAAPADVYRLLEPLLSDYRRLRLKSNADIRVLHLDEFVDQLLTESYSCDVALPHLPARHALEQQGLLQPRRSPLEADIDEINDDDNLNATNATTAADSVSRSASVSRSVSRSPSVSRSASPSRSRSVSRSPPPRRRSRSPSPAVAAAAKPKMFVKGLKNSKFHEKQVTNTSSNAPANASSAGATEIEQMNALRATLGLKPLGNSSR